jgi:hypothetical protein
MCTGVCTPAAVQCSGNAVETCSSTGAWGSPVACPGAEVCSGGVCTSTLSVEYLCDNINASTQQVQPYFKIANTGSAAVALSTLKIRYFFTADGSATQVFNCDYAVVNCTYVTGTFYTWSGGGAADHYLEITFSAMAGSVAPGSDSGVIQARFHDQNYINFNQTNDYSFDATKTSFTNWTQVTLYQNDTLVWGTEP